MFRALNTNVLMDKTAPTERGGRVMTNDSELSRTDCIMKFDKQSA